MGRFLNINSISLTHIWFFKFPFLCHFWNLYFSRNLSVLSELQIYFFIIFPFNSFNVQSLTSDATSFIPHISNLCFLLFSLTNIVKLLINLIYFFKEPNVAFEFSLQCLFHWYLLLYLFPFFCLLHLICPVLSSFLKWKVVLLSLNLFSFLILAFTVKIFLQTLI